MESYVWIISLLNFQVLQNTEEHNFRPFIPLFCPDITLRQILIKKKQRFVTE